MITTYITGGNIMKLQTIVGLLIIGLAITVGILVSIDGYASITIFWLWMAVVIISRIHILILHRRE